MTVDRDGSCGEPSSNRGDCVISERVQELTWALLDEQITDDEFGLLDNLLLSDKKARQSYVDCVQLHAELMSHFRGASAEKATAVTPVLGLPCGDSSLGLHSTGGEVVQ